MTIRTIAAISSAVLAHKIEHAGVQLYNFLT